MEKKATEDPSRCPINYCMEACRFLGDRDMGGHYLSASSCGFCLYSLPFTRMLVEDGKSTGKGRFRSVDSLIHHLVPAHGTTGIPVFALSNQTKGRHWYVSNV